MLFLISGASGSGKSRVRRDLEAQAPDLLWLDFDDPRIPPDPGKAGRQRRLDAWLRVVLEAQARGQSAVLFGQSPLGEVLAAPSAPALTGVRALLLDVGDVERVARLRGRGTPDLATQDMLNWAAWHRLHASDPRWRPDVLREDGWTGMRWDRWAGWTAARPQWRVSVLDSTGQTAEQTAGHLLAWVRGGAVTP